MGDIAYTSKLKILRDEENHSSIVYVEGIDTPIVLGKHGPLKEHFAFEPKVEHPASQDYLTAALVG